MPADSISPGAVKMEDEHRREICTAGRWIHGRGFVASTDGNISVRLDSRRILTSPTGVSKGLMSPDDLVITDLQGRKLAGRREPSTELGMHLLIYVRRPDVNAVCHAHPPIATAHAAAGLPLNKALLSEIVLSLGCVPVAQYGTPGTPELSDALEPLEQLRRDPAGQSRRRHLRRRSADRIFSHGDRRAFRAGFAGQRAARQTSLAFWP